PDNFLGSVQLSRSVVSDSLRPHESQHSRPSCPSPTPRIYSNSCPSSWFASIIPSEIGSTFGHTHLPGAKASLCDR
ncbi:unnamed protein product, partial [Rangifer tarandus platyrhynchus]